MMSVQPPTDDFDRSLHALVDEFNAAYAADPHLNHATVQYQFVKQLLELLDWPTHAGSCDFERRQDDEGGIPDAILCPSGTPVMAVEVKRPKEPAAHQIPDIQQGSQYNARQLGPGLREKLRYVMYEGAQARWLMLVSMTHLHIFDSVTKRWVLAFNSTDELRKRLDDLLLLRFDAVMEGSLERQAHRYAAKPVESLLDSLNQWRLRLAKSVWELNQGRPDISLELVQAAVRRMLDRLIIIQIIDDKGLIAEHPGLLDEQVDQWDRERSRSIGGIRAFRDRLRNLFEEFNRRYNSTIFETDDTDKLTYDDEVLAEVASGIAGTGFADLNARIIGTAYERYAGYKLEIADGELRREVDLRFRQTSGTYYTPDYIVKYVVDRTVHPLLEGKTVEDIQDFRILDKACGSGSFLIGAFDGLARFYESERQRLAEIMKETHDTDERRAAERALRLTENYPRTILERHLYGVDLNPEAAEFATVSLIIHALEYRKQTGGVAEDLHLPLILNQNVKVGNSVISALDTMDDAEKADWLREHRDNLHALRDLRARLHDITAAEEKQETIQEIRRLTDEINSGEDGLNARLAASFGSPAAVAKRSPFNWEVEFPEVFDPDEPPDRRGFDCDVGNPPYVKLQRMMKSDSPQVDYLRTSPAFKSTGNYDLYVVFLERALQVSRSAAGFIVSRKFFYQEYGEAIRSILSGGRLRELVDFTHLQVFEESDATTYTCLVIMDKSPGGDQMRLARVTEMDISGDRLSRLPPDGVYQENGLRADQVPTSGFGSDPWVPVFDDERAVMRRMEENSVSLGEGGLGAHIFVGIQTSADDVYIMDYVGEDGDCYVVRTRRGEARRGDGQELRIEKGILKPLLSGEDVRAYGTPSLRQLLLFPYDVVEEETKRTSRLVPWDELSARYPLAAEYLAECRVPLEEREKGKMRNEKWYAYVYPKNLAIQESRKLVVPSLVRRFRALHDEGTWFLDNVNAIGVALPGSKHLYPAALCLLNSRCVDWFLRTISTPFRGGFYQPNKQFLDRVPVPKTIADGAAELGALSSRLEELARERSGLCTDFLRFVQGMPRDRKLGDLTSKLRHADRKVLAEPEKESVRAVAVRREDEWLVLRASLRDAAGDDRAEDVYRMKVAEPTASLIEHFLPTLGHGNYSQSHSTPVLRRIQQIALPNGSDDEVRSALDAFLRDKSAAEKLEEETREAERAVDRICARLYGLEPDHLALMGM